MKRFQGVITALVTPFRDGQIDEKALIRLIESQIADGVQGLVPVGTTGESPTLSYEEHLRVIEITVQTVKGRIPVIAGTGSNSTKEAVYLTQEAEKLGVDGALLVAPYYNKPTQIGLLAHFGEIAKNTKIPLILYSIPGRCGIEISVETVAQLAKNHSNIVAIKEAGGQSDRVSQLRQALPDSFDILCGDDSLFLSFMAVGAVGVISVASNLIPKPIIQMMLAFQSGKIAEAEKMHRKLYPVFKDIFIETNPAPIKAAMARLGLLDPEVRLPLVPIQPANQEKVFKAFDSISA
ncbi:MAG: 4-hydroxy-tetrahydrodipicolinate synthase [Verrucomicrobiota bacterium]